MGGAGEAFGLLRSESWRRSKIGVGAVLGRDCTDPLVQAVHTALRDRPGQGFQLSQGSQRVAVAHGMQCDTGGGGLRFGSGVWHQWKTMWPGHHPAI